MRVVVLGAGGVVGQHMMLSVPSGVEAEFVRTTANNRFVGLDLREFQDVERYLDQFNPEVIVNLAGENRVDTVEESPSHFLDINVTLPTWLAGYCENSAITLIQGSTQGVFSGENPPYKPTDVPHPITEYGKQKSIAERTALEMGGCVARLTFVLGLRPFGLGRVNPIESMFTTAEQLQVNDRWFSPLFAKDAAEQLWLLALSKRRPPITHLGTPISTNRYQIACSLLHSFEGLSVRIIPVSHNHFPGIAPRPKDTTWASGSKYRFSLSDGLRDIIKDWNGSTNKS